MNKLVACNKCDWVHFQVNTEYVIKWEKDWADRWPKMSEEEKELFGHIIRPPTIEDKYINCFRCGETHRNFRDVKDSEQIPAGSTIQPILDRESIYR